MVVIRLYGLLEDAAQRTLLVNTRSFDESLRALFANFPKLRGVLSKINVSILIDGKTITSEDCLRPFHAERIDIMPVVGGNGPAVFILAGAALSAGATAIGTYLAGTSLFTALAISQATAIAMVSQFGIALILGGISQILFKPPKPNNSLASDAPDSRASYTFNGAINTTTQGNVVAVGFGRMRVGSQVIASNVQTWDVPVPVTASPPPPAPPPAPEEWNSASWSPG